MNLKTVKMVRVDVVLISVCVCVCVTQSEKKYNCAKDSDCTKHLNKPGSYGEIFSLSFSFPFYFKVFDENSFIIRGPSSEAAGVYWIC